MSINTKLNFKTNLGKNVKGLYKHYYWPIQNKRHLYFNTNPSLNRSCFKDYFLINCMIFFDSLTTFISIISFLVNTKMTK